MKPRQFTAFFSYRTSNARRFESHLNVRSTTHRRVGRVLLPTEITLPPAPRSQPPKTTELLCLVFPLRTQVNHTELSNMPIPTGAEESWAFTIEK
jgi:hypothetical protein